MKVAQSKNRRKASLYSFYFTLLTQGESAKTTTSNVQKCFKYFLMLYKIEVCKYDTVM